MNHPTETRYVDGAAGVITTQAQNPGQACAADFDWDEDEPGAWPLAIRSMVLNVQEDVARLRDVVAGRPLPKTWQMLTRNEYLERIADSLECVTKDAEKHIEQHVFPHAGQFAPHGASVLQDWVAGIPMMQQTVLLTAIRGPDGLPKYGAIKMLLRWYRRCTLLSAMDRSVIPDPIDATRGGSFTGPSLDGDHPEDPWGERMQVHVNQYLKDLDAIPHHFQMHFMHGVEILGYKHPVTEIRFFWHQLYKRLVHDMHVWPETEAQLDGRLGDNRAGWLERADPATVA